MKDMKFTDVIHSKIIGTKRMELKVNYETETEKGVITASGLTEKECLLDLLDSVAKVAQFQD